MRKVERTGGGSADSSLEGDWMPAGGLILNALTCAVDEKRHIFSGQQQTYIVEVISFLTSRLGMFYQQSPAAGRKIFLTNV